MDASDLERARKSFERVAAFTDNNRFVKADLDSLEKRVDAATKKARGGDEDAKARVGLMQRILVALRDGKPARTVQPTEEEAKMYQELQLITAKPGMVWNCFSSGSATEVAMVSGLAPGKLAKTLITGVL